MNCPLSDGEQRMKQLMTEIPALLSSALASGGMLCHFFVKRSARSIEAEGLNCTVKRQKRRGLKLSFPFRSSRERNSTSRSINSGSEKYSKMIFSPWVTHKQTPNVIIVMLLRHQWKILCVLCDLSTSPISSCDRSSFGFSEAAWIIISLKGRETKKRLLWFIDNNKLTEIWRDTSCL